MRVLESQATSLIYDLIAKRDEIEGLLEEVKEDLRLLAKDRLRTKDGEVKLENGVSVLFPEESYYVPTEKSIPLLEHLSVDLLGEMFIVTISPKRDFEQRLKSLPDKERDQIHSMLSKRKLKPRVKIKRR
jgi:hypothetical protein